MGGCVMDNKAQISRDAPTTSFNEKFKTQKYVEMAPSIEALKEHFANLEQLPNHRLMSLTDKLVGVPGILVPLEEHLEGIFESRLLQHLSENALINSLETILERHH
jgi:hypothetical protein